jgi:uncharacterized radical SAM superfamily Fe-S cluster-containing enzyme
MNTERDGGQSLCPQCLKLIPAWQEREGGDVYHVKGCPEHGLFRSLIWRGAPEFDQWRRPKIPARLDRTQHKVDRGCPFDCGLCPEHRQRTCTAILEVTQACDLGCPVCYAGSTAKSQPEPGLEQIAGWYRSVAQYASGCNIQLSGGEPTMRDDLPDIVAMGGEHGFEFIQVNTNGLRMGRDEPYVASLARAGLASIFLQFDGVDDRAYRHLRGRPLLAEKLAAVENCRRHGIGVVLVPTIARGVNLGQVGGILDLARELSPTVRAVHFQPMSRFGRFPSELAEEDRVTLPDLMRAIEEQTNGLFPVKSFRPPGCENSLCSFQGNFLLKPDGSVQALSLAHDGCCSPKPEPAEMGALRTISRVSRQWVAPRVDTAQGTGADRGERDGPIALDDFIVLARQNTLAVSAMAFQDAWNLDLDRVRDCCIHVVSPQGDLVPFCLYNLTGADGRRLYRP